MRARVAGAIATLWAATVLAEPPDGGVSDEADAAVVTEGASELPDAGVADPGLAVEATDAGLVPAASVSVGADGDAGWPIPGGEGPGLASSRADAGAPVRETVVVAPPLDIRRIAGSAHSVSAEQLERYEYDDVHRVLAQVPGVYLRDEDGYGLRPNVGLRGATSDRSSKVTLMEDGVLFAPAPYSAPAAYYFPLVTRMDGVEVYKGPASVRFGPNTIGGAVNLRTRPIPTETAAAIDVAAGTRRFGKVHGFFGRGGERWGLLLEGVHLETGGFKRLDGGGDTGFDKNELMLKARYSPGGHHFELKMGYADERSNETYLGLADDDFRVDPLRRYAASRRDQMRWTRTQFSLSHAFELSPWSFRTVAYRHDFRRAWRKLNRFRGGPELFDLLSRPGTGQSRLYLDVLRGEADTSAPDETLMVGTNDRAFVSQGVQSVARWSSNGGPVEQVLEIGGRFHHDAIERLHWEDGFLMQRAVLVPEGGEALVTTWNRGSTSAGAFYVTDELSIGPFLLVPGARVELIETRYVDHRTGNSQRSFDVVPLGGLGAVWQLSKPLSLIAGAHQGFSPVSPGQPDGVLPERSVSYEGGVRWRTRAVRAELVGFFNDYFNLTGECTFSTGCSDELLNRQFNAGEVSVWGLEAAVGLKRAAPFGLSFELDAAYTLTRSEFRSSFRSEAPQFGDVRAGDELPYVPMHQAAASAHLARNGHSLSLSASYVSAMREVAGQGEMLPYERTDPHLVLDAAAHVELSERTELYLTVTNVLDARYVAARRPFGARPGAPRELQVGLEHRF